MEDTYELLTLFMKYIIRVYNKDDMDDVKFQLSKNDKEITKKIVRMFESGELSHTQENHNWNGYDIKVELKNFKEHGLDTSDGVVRQEKSFAPTAVMAHPRTEVLKSRLQAVERTDRSGRLNAGLQMKRPRASGRQCQIEPLHSCATNHRSAPASQVLD